MTKNVSNFINHLMQIIKENEQNANRDSLVLQALMKEIKWDDNLNISVTSDAYEMDRDIYWSFAALGIYTTDELNGILEYSAAMSLLNQVLEQFPTEEEKEDYKAGLILDITTNKRDYVRVQEDNFGLDFMETDEWELDLSSLVDYGVITEEELEALQKDNNL